MQTRWQSMVEAFLNTLTGYIISVVAQVLIFPHYGIHLGLGENMQIVAIFTFISIVRSYFWRRLFNHLHRPKGLGDHHGRDQVHHG